MKQDWAALGNVVQLHVPSLIQSQSKVPGSTCAKQFLTLYAQPNMKDSVGETQFTRSQIRITRSQRRIPSNARATFASSPTQLTLNARSVSYQIIFRPRSLRLVGLGVMVNTYNP